MHSNHNIEFNHNITVIPTVHLFDAVHMWLEAIALFQNFLVWFYVLCFVQPQNDSVLVGWLSQGSHIVSVNWDSQAHLFWTFFTAMNNRTLFSVFGWNWKCH